MKRLTLLTLAALVLTVSGQAFGQDRCDGLALEAVSDPRTVSYAAFGETASDEPFLLRIRRDGDRRDCRFLLTLQSEDGSGGQRTLSGTAASLRYEILDSGGGLVGNGSRSRDEIAGRMSEGVDTLDLQLRLSIPAGQAVESGSYSDRIIVRLLERKGGGRLVDEALLTVRAAVESRAEINLSQDAGVAFNLGRTYDVVEFGELETGEQRAIFLRVRANAGYRMSLDSANRGRLVRTGAGANPGADEQIDYAARLDGRAVTLSGPETLIRTGIAPGATEELIFEVRIGNVEDAAAGRYTDQITVFVEPIR